MDLALNTLFHFRILELRTIVFVMQFNQAIVILEYAINVNEIIQGVSYSIYNNMYKVAIYTIGYCCQSHYIGNVPQDRIVKMIFAVSFCRLVYEYNAAAAALLTLFPPSFSDFQINFNLFSNSVLFNPCSLLCLFSDSNLNLDWISEANKLYEQLHNKTTTRRLEQIIYI
jgi:hypothetical protein